MTRPMTCAGASGRQTLRKSWLTGLPDTARELDIKPLVARIRVAEQAR